MLTDHAAPVAAPCFHCGLPVLENGAVRAPVGGTLQPFCCPGCVAVAQAIVGQGLGDYYRSREAMPERPGDVEAAGFAAYDEPLAQSGFVTHGPGEEREASLLLEGIRCSACVWLNEQTLARVPGVLSAEVNYATRRARVRWDASRTKLSRVLGAVAAIGYRAYPFEARRAEALQHSERRAALWRLFVAGFGMMQVMMYAFPAYIAEEGTMTAGVGSLMRWASLVLTVPVVCYAAAPFFLGALRDIRAGRPGMDVPVAIGIAAAFAASVWATVRGTGEVYFDSVTMFVFLLLAGRYLELRARQRAGSALDYLARLVPETCLRLTAFPASFDAVPVPVAALLAGESVLVRPGDVVPADGVVVQGEGAVNEALLTGESSSVHKRAGDEVVGGSINAGSVLIVRVVRVGSSTVLSGIVRMVERATAEKQRIVEIAGRFAHWFVLGVLAVAAATAVGWAMIDADRALWITVSVLVVTCPCALSLATPVALTVATGELARRGFIVTRGHTIETLARATDFVFDKTGTLTYGVQRVTSAVPLADVSLEHCLALARALEAGSEHPAARALCARAGAGGPQAQVTGRRNEPGAGVEGIVDGRRYRIGAPAFCGGADAADDPAWTVVLLSDETRLLARFVLGDVVRPEAARLIETLRGIGKSVHLLSGDSQAAAHAVGAELRITRVRARATPDQKQAYLRELQAERKVVAMIGDGINDAPVLAQADVSVAMASGAHLAQARADAVLLSDHLGDLAAAVTLSRRTLAIIRQNVAWAVLYNGIVLPAAIAGFVTPWMAGIGMSGSSLAVVLNALRLRTAPPVAASRETAAVMPAA